VRWRQQSGAGGLDGLRVGAVGRTTSAAAGAGRGATALRAAAGLGAAGAGTIALVVIGGFAAGALLGTLLRRQFGTAKAVRAEEAAVAGALALRETRADVEQELGRALTTAERQKLFRAYEANLQELGFTKNRVGQWERQRGAIERLLG